MTHILRYLRPLTLIAAAVLSLSCESKQELQDRMDAIAGEYRLAAMVIGTFDFIYNLPQAEKNAASARIFQDGNGWIVEYTVPFLVKASSPLEVSLHRIRQRIVWDRQLADYLISDLTPDDLPQDLFNPAAARLKISASTEGKSTILFSHTSISATWIQK